MAEAEEYAAAARRGETAAAEIMRNALSAAQSAVDGAGTGVARRGDDDVAGRIERAGQLAGGHAFFGAMQTLESLDFPLSPRRLAALGQPSGRLDDHTGNRRQPATPPHAGPQQGKGRTQAEAVREWRDMATSPMPRVAVGRTTAEVSTTPGRPVEARDASEQLADLVKSVRLQADVPVQPHLLDRQRYPRSNAAAPSGQFVPQLTVLAQPASTYHSSVAPESGCSTEEVQRDLGGALAREHKARQALELAVTQHKQGRVLKEKESGETSAKKVQAERLSSAMASERHFQRQYHDKYDDGDDVGAGAEHEKEHDNDACQCQEEVSALLSPCFAFCFALLCFACVR
eukprot:COSAG02_NODE_1048_length_14977_cov_26.690953_6_plen_345_part_00